MKILVTAFEPFGSQALNPALEVLRCLPDQLAGAELIRLPVPVVFGLAAQTVIQAIEEYQPQACLMLGLAGGRAEISLERAALNVDDARIPDNYGEQPQDQPIDPHGPAAYFTTLPFRAMIAAVLQQGVPAGVSNSAGTYVCNHLMYAVLHHIAQHGLAVRAGFMHLPFLPQQAAAEPNNPPSLPLDALILAVETCLRVIIYSAQLPQA